MRPNQYFVWSADYGNHLDIQFNVRLWAQTCNWGTTGKRIREYFMPTKPLGNRLSLHGKIVLRNDSRIDDRLLPLLTIERSLEPTHFQPYLYNQRRNWTIHIPSFFILSYIFHKTLIKLLPQPLNSKNLLPTFEQSISL